jgi:hypothetical protein
VDPRRRYRRAGRAGTPLRPRGTCPSATPSGWPSSARSAAWAASRTPTTTPPRKP